MSKNFAEVFEQISLPAGVSNPLKNAVVNGISVNRAEKKMNIDIELFEMVAEDCLGELSRKLIEQFPQIEDVEINHKYDLQSSDGEKIDAFWGNIVARVHKTSPLCGRILEDSKRELADGNLILSIENNGAFLLTKRGIERQIQDILTNTLKTGVRLVLKSVEGKSAPKHEIALRTAEKEAIAAAMSLLTEAGSEREAQKPAPAPQQNPSWSTDKTFKKGGGGRKQVKINNGLSGVMTKLSEELETDDEVIVEGVIFGMDKRETKSGKILISFDMTDKSGSVTVKLFIQPEKFDDGFKSLLAVGNAVKVLGRVQYDDFSKEINIMAIELCPGVFEASKRTDNASEKRVELHLHTTMSQMDAVTSAESYIKRAKEWGHKAVAITDHGVVQAFPEAMDAAKKAGVKVIFGVEAYLTDDLNVCAAKRTEGRTLDTDFVVFDLETTGLSPKTCKIIEIGAAKIRNGEIIDRFSSFVNPQTVLPDKIVELTGITDAMLFGAPLISAVLPDFMEFIGGSVLVAHNAAFDMGFLEEQARLLGIPAEHGYVCTVELSRALFPQLQNHKLNTLAKHLGVSLENHHRAVNDAEATGEIFIKCLEMLNAQTFDEINLLTSANVDRKSLRHKHAVILVKNYAGLRNLYELVSLSHLHNFYKRPRIPKSEFLRLREGLLIGTACEAGEFYTAVRENKPEEEIKRLADFYDYFEIQPVGNNMYLYREGLVSSVDDLRDINRRIVAYGEQFGKPVVAAGDVHFLDPEDEVYRRIIMTGGGFKDADNQAPLFYRTTEEMLAEFAYLGEEKAYEVVVTNTNMICGMTEEIKPIPDGTFAPEIPGAEEELKRITADRAREIYGDPLPKIVGDRLERELSSIIKNGFSVMYVIAQKLVWDSVSNGYLVGSRGSVGSSFVATMAEITEVNPLPPHYYCEACKFTDFDSELVKPYAGASGCDMPDRDCPNCGAKLKKDGHDIPFETFLGFDGDKEPDIDLNFSGEYQAKAHAYTEQLFGADYVFKAGTIGTLADKTAYGYVKKYLEAHNRQERGAEINRLSAGCTGIKRTTGQHPGGLVVVPKGRSIYEFTPVQHPANDAASGVITTHFDYHSISGRLLKLDILGHDVPTIVRMLHDITGIDPRTVDLGDKDVISLFTSPKKLGVTAEEIDCKTGSLGLPEFGTSFVRKMLESTRPTTFAELVRISGLSHGTNVWFNNAEDLIKDGVATLKDVIPTRDDIMVYLILKGVEKLAAFKIMENVRKGKGLTDAEVEIMQAADVPEWYIESCRRISYMFPKGHAVAYVMMTVRIGYFKIHHPYAFYAATFSVKAGDFDYDIMCKGKETAKEELRRIIALGNEASAKEKSMQTTLELVIEMYARGLNFVPLDLYKSEASKFVVTENGLLPPLCSIQGLGENAAQGIVDARKDGEFFSVEDFKQRTKTTKNVIELMKANRILHGLPDTDQLSLFN